MLKWLGLSGRAGQLVLGLAITVSVVAACNSGGIETSTATPSLEAPSPGPTRAADATVAVPSPAITPVRTSAPRYFPYEISNAVGLASGMFFDDDPTFGGAYIDAGGTGHGVFLFTGNALSSAVGGGGTPAPWDAVRASIRASVAARPPGPPGSHRSRPAVAERRAWSHFNGHRYKAQRGARRAVESDARPSAHLHRALWRGTRVPDRQTFGVRLIAAVHRRAHVTFTNAD
jgi:hypothetical protein